MARVNHNSGGDGVEFKLSQKLRHAKELIKTWYLDPANAGNTMIVFATETSAKRILDVTRPRKQHDVKVCFDDVAGCRTSAASRNILIIPETGGRWNAALTASNSNTNRVAGESVSAAHKELGTSVFSASGQSCAAFERLNVAKVNFVLNYDVPPSLTSYICRLGLCQHALTQVQVSKGYAQALSLFYAQKLKNDVD